MLYVWHRAPYAAARVAPLSDRDRPPSVDDRHRAQDRRGRPDNARSLALPGASPGGVTVLEAGVHKYRVCYVVVVVLWNRTTVAV